MRRVLLLFFHKFSHPWCNVAHCTSEIMLRICQSVSCFWFYHQKCWKALFTLPCWWKDEELLRSILGKCLVWSSFVQPKIDQFIVSLVPRAFVGLQIDQSLFTSSYWEISRANTEWIPNVCAFPSLGKYRLISSFSRCWVTSWPNATLGSSLNVITFSNIPNCLFSMFFIYTLSFQVNAVNFIMKSLMLLSDPWRE